MRWYSRGAVGVVVASLAMGMAGCGGEDEAPDEADPGSTRSAAAEPSVAPVQAGSTELPAATGIADLPAVDVARGAVLVQRDADGGCVILTYDGQAGVLGTFPAFRTEHQPRTQQCDDRHIYSADFKTRVGEIYANWKNANSFNIHTVVQPIGAAERDVTSSGSLTDPAIGPDGRLYVNRGSNFSGKPAVMNLDGSGLTAFPDGEFTPAWLGGKLVSARTAADAVSNPDGSLAVQYISGSTPRYRVGPVSDGRIDGDVVTPVGTALKPLAWAGGDRFLASDAGVIYAGTVVVGGEKPTVTLEPLATLPERYLSASSNPVSAIGVCGDRAYFTIQLGGTRALPDYQSVLLSMNVADGTLTAHASVKDYAAAGVRHSAEVIGCGR